MAKVTCPQAKRTGQRLIQCRQTGQPCAHQRWCLMEGQSVLSDGAWQCPARDGKKAKQEGAADEQGQGTAGAGRADAV